MSNAAKFRKKAAELESQRDFDKAIVHYARAIEAGDDAGEEVDVAVLNKVGDLTLRLGRVPEAVASYERAVEHYTAVGLFNNAIALCNKILRHAPGRVGVYLTLGRVCARKGMRGDATRNFLEYASRMQKEGRNEEAMTSLSEVASIMPELTEVRRLVEEHAARVGIALPTAVEAAAAQEKVRGPSDSLVFLDIDYDAVAFTPPIGTAALPFDAAPTGHAVRGSDVPSAPPARSSSLDDLLIFDPSTAGDDQSFDALDGFEANSPEEFSDELTGETESLVGGDLDTHADVEGADDLTQASVPEGLTDALGFEPINSVDEPTADELDGLVPDSGDGMMMDIGLDAEEASPETVGGWLDVPQEQLREDVVDAPEGGSQDDLEAAQEAESHAEQSNEVRDDVLDDLIAADEPMADGQDVEWLDLGGVDGGDLGGLSMSIDDAVDADLAAQDQRASAPLTFLDLDAMEAMDETSRVSVPDPSEASATPVSSEAIVDVLAFESADEPPVDGQVETDESADSSSGLIAGADVMDGASDSADVAEHELDTVDAELLDAELSDVVALDVELLDAELLDVELSDVVALDAELLDAELLDAELLNAELLDPELLDAEPSDVLALDAEQSHVAELEPSVVSAMATHDSEQNGLSSGAHRTTDRLDNRVPSLVEQVTARWLTSGPRLNPHDFILPGELPPIVIPDSLLPPVMPEARSAGAADNGRHTSPAPTLDFTELTESVVDVSGGGTDEADFGAVDVVDSIDAIDAIEVADDFADVHDVNDVDTIADTADINDVADTADVNVVDIADDVADADVNAVPDVIDDDVDDLSDDADLADLDALFVAEAPAEVVNVALVRCERLREEANAHPGDWARRRRLAEALLEAGELEDGLTELAATSLGLEVQGALEDAARVCDDMVRAAPDNIGFHQKRVELAVRLGDRERLRESYLDLADALVRTGLAARAESVYVRVLELDPWDDRARIALGDAAPPPPARPAVASSADDGYVNLADWLSDDGATTDTRMRLKEPTVTGDQDADFDRLLQHFRDGVARSLGEDDYESHYDLGVAYKEMGLLDDAIAEFQRALRSPTHRLPAYEALGQCFLEQGSFPVAVTVLSRALHEPGLNDEQRVGVLYLLGYACEALQRRDEARSYYQRVYATDIQFRDVADRLAALEQVA